MRIAILGAHGQLGKALTLALAMHELVLLGHEDCAVEDYDSLANALSGGKFDVIINCTAMHRLDACEADPKRAYEVNTLGAHNVAKLAKELGAVVVHISTDYVFDGTTEGEYAETDLPHPLNFYGVSKLAGEHAVAVANPSHYIIRTSALFGGEPTSKGKSFVLQMLERAKGGAPIRVVMDQYTVPTYTPHLAKVIDEIVSQKIPFGTYHAVGGSGVTWYDYAKEIFVRAGMDFAVEGVETEQKAGSPQRPLRSVLSSKKLNQCGIYLPSWKDGLRDYLELISK